MGDPCKLMKASLLNHKTKQSCLATKPCNRSMKHAPKPIKQQWNKTHILPSDLSKLMIPRTCSSRRNKNKNIRKGWHYTETWDDLPFLTYVTTFLLISIVPWQSCLDPVGTRKPPCLTWRRSWWCKLDVYSRMRKKVVLSSSPLFLWL